MIIYIYIYNWLIYITEAQLKNLSIIIQSKRNSIFTGDGEC